MKVINNQDLLAEILKILAAARGVTPIEAITEEELRAQAIVNKHCHKGNSHLRKILGSKGIEDQRIIDKVIANLPTEAERAIAPARKKLARVKAKSDQEKIAKTAMYLVTIGFPYDVSWLAAKEQGRML